MIKNAIFDLDGTIANSFDKFISVLKKVSLSSKVKPNFSDKVIETYRNSDPIDILKSLNISVFELPKYIKKIFNELQDYNEQVACFAGVKDVLQEFRESGIFLGVISSNNIKNITSFLKKNDMEMFDSISASGLFSKSSSIKKMMKKHSLNCEETIYVGDEIRDIKASKQAGIRVISVTWGFQSRALLEGNKPDFIAEKPEDIIKIIKQEY